MKKVTIVTGAGGFVGGHLVRYLRDKDQQIIKAIDIKPFNEWFQKVDEVENLRLDLRLKRNCEKLFTAPVGDIYNLAADMGGMGFIENNRALCMLSVLINTHLLQAAKEFGVNRYFYSSSACVYNIEKQKTPDSALLREEDAYPALPEDGYGWEKLFSERMCRHFAEDFGLTVRVARLHNVYGPYGTWEGGREKAPAAICRKVIEARLCSKDDIEIWGDGAQMRSFMYIDDCIKGIDLIMNSNVNEPINLGTSELVTINQLVDIAESFAGLRLNRKYNLDAPRGVNCRNSDNSRIKKYIDWEPSMPLRAGLEKTYKWIENEYQKKYVDIT